MAELGPEEEVEMEDHVVDQNIVVSGNQNDTVEEDMFDQVVGENIVEGENQIEIADPSVSVENGEELEEQSEQSDTVFSPSTTDNEVIYDLSGKRKEMIILEITHRCLYTKEGKKD